MAKDIFIGHTLITDENRSWVHPIYCIILSLDMFNIFHNKNYIKLAKKKLFLDFRVFSGMKFRFERGKF